MPLKSGSSPKRAAVTAPSVGGKLFRDLSETDVFQPRLIVCATAGQKRGKTHFALSFPAPIAYVAIEPAGLEGVAQKFKGKVIRKTELNWVKPTKELKGTAKVIESAGEALDKWERAVDEAISDGYRTLIGDTWTELWELFRTAAFGKLGEVKPHHYGPVNLAFKESFARIAESNMNLVMIHRVKAEYKDEKSTGAWVRDGYKGAEYDAQVCVTLDRDYGPDDRNANFPTGPFIVRVDDCRQNAGIVGQYLTQPNCGFLDLAKLVYPDVDESVWGV